MAKIWQILFPCIFSMSGDGITTLTKELHIDRCHYITNSVIKEIGNGTLMVEVYELMWLDISGLHYFYFIFNLYY